MISKLPIWVWVGGDVLALIAGIINAVGLIGFEHQAVSHMTGVTSQLGLALAQGDTPLLQRFLLILVSFFIGAILSGCIVRDSTLKLGRRYGVALGVESLMLFLSIPLLIQHHPLGACLASCACGLQNGLASTYSGAIIRTTHVSGLLTDVGLILGNLVVGNRPDLRRLILSFSLIVAFLLGGYLGALLFMRFEYHSLYLPAALTGVMALGYGVFLWKRRIPS